MILFDDDQSFREREAARPTLILFVQHVNERGKGRQASKSLVGE